MAFQPWQLHRSTSHRHRRPGRRQRVALGLVVVAGAIGLMIWWVTSRRGTGQEPVVLSATSSAQSSEAASAIADDFATAVCRAIQQDGRITVTVHVALADKRRGGTPTKFGDGDKPEENLYWGARFGVETFLTQAGGWRRAYADDGDGGQILRRVVLHRRTESAPAWEARGVTRPFDVYVLANAWRASAVTAAMAQPLRDALGAKPVRLTVEGVDLEFGAGSVMSGYVGPNGMEDGYQDPFAELAAGPAGRQMGVFYVSAMSAVYLHRPVIDHGLYSVLFVRRAVVPEAYVLAGVLESLAAGELDEGFVEAAAAQYVSHQKNCTPQQARFLFYR